MVQGYGGGPPGNDPFRLNPFLNDPFTAPPNARGDTERRTRTGEPAAAVASPRSQHAGDTVGGVRLRLRPGGRCFGPPGSVADPSYVAIVVAVVMTVRSSMSARAVFTHSVP